MTVLIFARHGETSWSSNQDHRFRGRLDIPLTKVGILQAKAVGNRLKTERINAIYSSPLKRAKNTAIEIANFHGLPVIEHDGFIDLDFGTWQGMQHEKLRSEQCELYTRWETAPHTMIFPDGETLDNVRVRIEQAISGLVSHHPNDSIVIITHGAVLRVALCYFHKVGNDKYWHYKIDNCSLLIVKHDNGKFFIIAENDNEHLSNLFDN
jgi:broad specificity phosphatase PhoE